MHRPGHHGIGHASPVGFLVVTFLLAFAETEHAQQTTHAVAFGRRTSGVGSAAATTDAE